MKLAVLLVVVATVVLGAGYIGIADQIAQGFMILSVFFGALVILGSAAGGIRVWGRPPASRRLASRVRRSTAA